MEKNNIHTTDFTHRYSKEVKVILSRAQGEEGLNLKKEVLQSLVERFSEIRKIKEGWKVVLRSDNLTLDDKISIENYFMREVSKINFNNPVTIYFKRFQKRAVAKPQKTITYLKKSQKKKISGVKKIICVASGKGGVGKSTMSVGVASSLSNKGYRVGILDGDIHGPSIPCLLGVTEEVTVNASGKIKPVQVSGLQCMSFGFFSDQFNPIKWRGPLLVKGLMQMCFDVLWDQLDILVIDLPPGTGDIHMSLIEQVEIDGVVIVTTPHPVSLLDAAKGLTMFEGLGVPVLGVINNMSSFSCIECGAENPISESQQLQQFVKRKNLPVLASFPLTKQLSRMDQGLWNFPAESPLGKGFSNISSSLIRHISI